jgi:squalene cyclase
VLYPQIASNEDNRERYYRHVSKGGWPFSTAAHGWPISDCTSEGLKGVLALHSAKLPASLIPLETRISDARLCDACDVLLSYHNADGGWATYENNRGYRWYEMLNPSEVFGDIMIDYSYVECSSACITALKEFAAVVPHYRTAEVNLCVCSVSCGRWLLRARNVFISDSHEVLGDAQLCSTIAAAMTTRGCVFPRSCS